MRQNDENEKDYSNTLIVCDWSDTLKSVKNNQIGLILKKQSERGRVQSERDNRI